MRRHCDATEIGSCAQRVRGGRRRTRAHKGVRGRNRHTAQGTSMSRAHRDLSRALPGLTRTSQGNQGRPGQSGQSGSSFLEMSRQRGRTSAPLWAHLSRDQVSTTANGPEEQTTNGIARTRDLGSNRCPGIGHCRVLDSLGLSTCLVEPWQGPQRPKGRTVSLSSSRHPATPAFACIRRLISSHKTTSALPNYAERSHLRRRLTDCQVVVVRASVSQVSEVS